MNANNNLVVRFFREVEKEFPIGKKIDYNLLDSRNNSLAIRWIRSKIPEFFLRGVKDFEYLYNIILDKDEGKTYDETLFSRLMIGNFQDIKTIESPVFQKMREILYDREIINQIYSLNNESLDISENISYDSYLYYVVNNYIREIGFENYNFDLYDDIIKYDNIASLAFETSKKQEVSRKIETLQEIIFSCEQKRLELLHQSEDVNKSLKKYNFITSFLFKKEKSLLEQKKKELEEKIEDEERIIATDKKQIEQYERDLELVNKYEILFSKIVNDKVIPILKDAILKRNDLKQDEQEQLSSLIERLFSREILNLSSAAPVSIIGRIPNTIRKFYNALATISQMAKSFTIFEEKENLPLIGKNQDEPSLLKIIRTELSRVPFDSDHGRIDINNYRDFKVHGHFNNFLSKAASPKMIESEMLELNKEYDDLMQTEDLDEYIKKVGILWYKFMLIHPYADGNGRTGRYLLNILLAHRNIIIPSLYDSLSDSISFTNSLDDFIVNNLETNYDKLGDFFLKKVHDCGIDLASLEKGFYNQREIEKNEFSSRIRH